MCYPLPGPRCSAHAAYRLAEARRKGMLYLAQSKDNGTKEYDEFEKYKKAIQKAERDYELTPAGLKELKEMAEKWPGSFSEEKYNNALKLRAAKLAAVKAAGKHAGTDEGDVPHKRKLKGDIRYTHTSFSEDGDVLKEIGFDDPDVNSALIESHNASLDLTSQEISALNWYSKDGYEYVNGYLSRNVRHADGSQRVKDSIKLMDSAFNKIPPRDEPVVVYRRHFHFNEEGGWSRIPFAQQKELIKEGTVFAPGIFMSTSLNPDNAPPDNDGVYFMEIKSKRAISLSSIASQGPVEMEFLLPRDAQYRVVSTSKKVTIEENNGKQRTLNVFQLEEI